jgi:hypothetical protein
MKSVLSTLEAKCPKIDVKACREIRWERGLDRWIEWMDELVKEVPPPPLGVVWFETPSELNPAVTSISGWTHLGPAFDSYGSEAERVWPIQIDGCTHTRGLHELDEVQEAWQRIGWFDEDLSETESTSLLPVAVALGYCTNLLFVLNGFPRTQLAALSNSARSIGVVTGWAAGSADPIGGMSARKWVSMPRVRAAAAERHAGPPSISERYAPKKYLARGGDPHWKDPKTGESLLHGVKYSELRDVKVLLEAGTDVNSADRKGVTVLHAFGAAQLAILRLLLAAGANPNAVTNEGKTVLDRLVWDGRCTVDHIKLLLASGANTPKANPLFEMALNDVHRRGQPAQERAKLRFWLREGWKIDERNAEGRSPLWIALERHASKPGRSLDFERRFGLPYDTAEYRADLTAIMFLREGSDPNLRLEHSGHPLIPDNATPLMIHRYDDDRLVRALLAHGADANAKCAKGRTAFDYARLAANTPGDAGHGAAKRVAAILQRAMRHAQ